MRKTASKAIAVNNNLSSAICGFVYNHINSIVFLRRKGNLKGTILKNNHKLIKRNIIVLIMRYKMNECIYPKGNSMTFPLELTQVQGENFSRNNRYLYPIEVMEIQKIIEDRCDQMEYDGSLMYDEYPDKVSVEAMARNICNKTNCKYQEEISNRWMNALVQMMLCNEMSYRRERRECHKRNLGKCIK